MSEDTRGPRALRPARASFILVHFTIVLLKRQRETIRFKVTFKRLGRVFHI